MSELKTKKSKRIFYFDALRALAIICVIVVHCVTLHKSLILSSWVAHPSVGLWPKSCTTL